MLKAIPGILYPVALGLLLGACSGSGALPVAAAAQAPPPLPTVPPGAAAVPFDSRVLVDQFGYRPGDRKVAVLRDPRAGYDQARRFQPGTSYQLRRAEDGGVVFSGRPSVWQGGAVDEASGDTGWWFDFSDVREPGTYFVHDEQNGVRSGVFRIDAGVYVPVLKAAMRTFFYQRSGFAKQAPWAEECWTDTPAYLGPDQDLEARDVTDRTNDDRRRNLSGGWFDAGDTNKYVTFATPPVHQLLTAFEQNPSVFTDDFGIPESGNGIPDLIDEVKWEINWLKRMQFGDGSVALKVGALDHASSERPGLDHSARYYVPACSSATIASAGMFAHAALAYAAFEPLAAESADLGMRAERAWRHFHAHSVQTECDDGQVKSGDADRSVEDQKAEAVVAAVYLHALTGRREYAEYVSANYRETQPFRDIGWSRYNPHQGEALLFHARQRGADGATARAIRTAKSADVEAGHGVYGFRAADNLYRAHLHEGQYHWGSNQVLANYGNTNLDAAGLIGSRGNAKYIERAGEILHYFHGVNPLAMVYLTNMYRHGATRSANEIFHSWFKDGTAWDSAVASACGPPPGFVPGGPNANAERDGVPASLTPPVGQPRQKSYRDWNTPWPDSSWAITEPAIYYQAAYIRLLAQFADQSSP